jgi:transposase
MDSTPDLDQLSERHVRELAARLLVEVRQKDQTIERIDQQNTHYHNTIQRVQLQNEQYKHELAILKRHQFARKSEVLNKHQRSLLDDLVEEDLAGIEEELERQTQPTASRSESQSQPKRKPLPPELPRSVIEHEPENTVCPCGCQMTRIGEDISEKLDYIPGTFTVEQHVRGKWACQQCETLTQASVPAQVIDKGIPAAGLLAQVLVAKYADHLPLNRQQQVFARAGLELPRSTLADWVGRCGVCLTATDRCPQRSLTPAGRTACG